MKEKIHMMVFVLVLGAVLTSALVAVDHYTAPRIERNRLFKIKKSVLGALGIAYTKDNVEEKFSQNIKTKEIDEEHDFYISQDGDTAFNIEGSGLWGPIEGVMALSAPDFQTIKGITIVHQEETPGLGGRIAEKEILDRFKDKKILPQLTIQPPGKAKKQNEVDGITGATLTGKAFEKILNSEAKKYLPLLRRMNDGT